MQGKLLRRDDPPPDVGSSAKSVSVKIPMNVSMNAAVKAPMKAPTKIAMTVTMTVAMAVAVSRPFASATDGADGHGQGPAAPERFEIGIAAEATDIAARNVDIMPDGEGLPEGSGSVEEGRAIYAKACVQCHGVEGQGGSVAALAGGARVDPATMAADRSIPHTIGNYWPFATTLFDYTRRNMPYDRPGSLTDAEVYAVTAYLLYLNDLVESDARLDAASLAQIRMPALRFFRPDGRSGEAIP